MPQRKSAVRYAKARGCLHQIRSLDMAVHPPRTRSLTALLGIALAIVLLTGLAGSSAEARTVGKHATNQVQRWHSPHAYTSPYAYVDVIHDGHRLDRVPIGRCRGLYSDRDITVQISTCGMRWYVRAVYVSLRSRSEYFRIQYFQRGNGKRANFRAGP
jgi:hypothetical protein